MDSAEAARCYITPVGARGWGVAHNAPLVWLVVGGTESEREGRRTGRTSGGWALYSVWMIEAEHAMEHKPAEQDYRNILLLLENNSREVVA